MDFIRFFMAQLLRVFLVCIKLRVSQTIPFLFLFLVRIFSATSELASIRASYHHFKVLSFVLIGLGSGCRRHQHISSVDRCHIKQLSSQFCSVGVLEKVCFICS